MQYGLPYQGSKSRIADELMKLLPSGKRFVDLFAGGCAIAHCALLSNKYESVLANDINYMPIQLFVDAVNGKYRDYDHIVTREEFNMFKDSDPYIKYICSFGNGGKNYLYGPNKEDIKNTASRMLIKKTLKERRLEYIKFIKELGEYLSSIQRLEQLEQLERLQQLETSNMSYEEYEYQEGDVVYCDIPYENTTGYNGESFDSKKFYEWAKSRPYQVFFSSYKISDDSFYKVEVKEIQQLMDNLTNHNKVMEYLYSNQPIRRENEQQSLF